MYNKYHAKKTAIDNIVFDSKREATRYQELKLLEKAGLITDLKLQPKFILQVGFTYEDEKVRPITYIGDFQYTDVESGKEIVEDVKGVKTKEFLIKRKLFLAKYGQQYTFKMVK